VNRALPFPSPGRDVALGPNRSVHLHGLGEVPCNALTVDTAAAQHREEEARQAELLAAQTRIAELERDRVKDFQTATETIARLMAIRDVALERVRALELQVAGRGVIRVLNGN
jgi:hypothetical protein